jgi:hypothetical protein
MAETARRSSTLLSGIKVPLRDAGGGSLGKATLLAGISKSHNGIRPSPRLRTRGLQSSGAGMLHRTSCLYHDLLGAALIETVL